MAERTLMLIAASLTLVLILGCAAPQLPEPAEPPSPTPRATPGSVQETSSATAAEIQEPTVSVPPGGGEATVSPPSPLPVTFDAEQTSVTLTGRLGEGDTHQYQFAGREGQPIFVSFAASEPVSLTVTQGDYLSVRIPAAEEIAWRGELPVSGETLVDIIATGATPYTLTLELPPSQEAAVELVQPAGDEVWLEGTAQTILWRSSGVGLVDIEAASGGKAWLLASEIDASPGSYLWEIPVGLISDFGVARSDAMSVRISSSREPALYDQNDRPFTVACPRITFDPGATSATVSGTLEPARDRFRYVLEAREDQALALEVSPASLEVGVWGAEDSSAWEIPSGSHSLSIAALPAAQDYFITLTNPSDDSAAAYLVDVTVR